MVPFAGFNMPVEYTGITEEHIAVRQGVGVFDVSHMGEFALKGPSALANLNYLLSNDHTTMVNGQIRYSLLCYENGTTVDDLLVYKKAEDDYLLVVNASNIQKDYEWIKDHLFDDVCLENISDQIAQIAIQGPKALQVITKLTANFPFKNYSFTEDVDLSGINCLLSRTGYTGEDGFEIYTSVDGIVTVWNKVLEVGKENGIKPTGLGCRDTLRFEASLPLYGHEISKEVTPLEGGFKFFVKLNKEADFIGKDALNKQLEAGLTRKVAGFEMVGRGIPREEYEVYKDGEKIGYVTTGYMSPTLKKNIGNALIDINETEMGNEIDIMIRNKPVKAKIISKKFYKR